MLHGSKATQTKAVPFRGVPVATPHNSAAEQLAFAAVTSGFLAHAVTADPGRGKTKEEAKVTAERGDTEPKRDDPQRCTDRLRQSPTEGTAVEPARGPAEARHDAVGLPARQVQSARPVPLSDVPMPPEHSV